MFKFKLINIQAYKLKNGSGSYYNKYFLRNPEICTKTHVHVNQKKIPFEVILEFVRISII